MSDNDKNILLEFHVPLIKLPLELLKIRVIFNDCIELLPLSIHLFRLLFRYL
jgi:hypothetical protein